MVYDVLLSFYREQCLPSDMNKHEVHLPKKKGKWTPQISVQLTVLSYFQSVDYNTKIK